jgi:acyl dehydratase
VATPEEPVVEAENRHDALAPLERRAQGRVVVHAQVARQPDECGHHVPDTMPQVGDKATRTRTVRERDIELFTELTGDRNPLHYDADAAARSRFGGIIVQGGVTSGLLNAVVAEELPGPGSVFLHVDWSFKAPVRPGDEITAEVEVLEVREDKPLTKLRTAITNQEGTVVLDGSALVWTEAV